MNKVYKYCIYLLGICIFISIGWWGSDTYKNYLNRNLTLPSWTKSKPLEKYTIENLSQKEIKPVKINILENLKNEENFSSNLFSFEFDPTLEYQKEDSIKKVTGLVNLPKKDEKTPVVLLIRGYANQSTYKTGQGSKNVGEYLANNGYTTISPDFLGYGGSSIESGNIFETRFQTYTTVLTLLRSINTDNFPSWDGKNIFIWAHSNGGQIALTTLVITKGNYPTVLWAPVVESFPYSILYYTNESGDKGKFIRYELSKFEANYNTDDFSFTNYLENINSPIELHIGTNDDAIPLEWTDRFVKRMENLKKDLKYYKHPLASHDMIPLWGDVIQKTFEFFENKRTITASP